jgi:release factor glutamine methyltransferase
VSYERPDATVLATDISPEALVWAHRNRDYLGLDVEFICCDLFSGMPAQLVGNVDVVVSNPPYVAEAERHTLPSEVVDYEPGVALFAGPDGIQVINRVVTEARRWLRSDGWLVLEIGETQGERVTALLADLGYEDVAISPDLTGRDRIAEGRRP